MIELLALILLFFFGNINTDVNTQLAEKSEQITIFGILDQSVPIRIELKKINDIELIGSIQYGRNSIQKQLIEGRLESGYYTFYEIQDEKVSGVIKGHSHPDSTQWTWSRYNYSLELPIRIVNTPPSDHGLIQAFESKNDVSLTGLFITDANKFQINNSDQFDMRWMEYDCVSQDCYEIRPDANLDNPLEFRTKEDLIIVLPDKELHPTLEVPYTNITIDSFDYLLSYSYPSIDDEFNNWAEQIINDRIIKDQLFITQQKMETDAGQRFSFRNYGDFYISLLTDRLVCGYLIFHSSSNGRMQTIPFTYDRNRHEMIGLKKIFKNDFDYSFFLKSYLEEAKRKLVYKEDRVLKELIELESFGHYTPASEGLVFFTEFNTLYGRRYIIVPYREIASFIRNKSLSSYIQRRIK